MVLLPLLSEILSNMCIATVCQPSWDVINFQINAIFQFKQIFLDHQKFKTKSGLLAYIVLSVLMGKSQRIVVFRVSTAGNGLCS